MRPQFADNPLGKRADRRAVVRMSIAFSGSAILRVMAATAEQLSFVDAVQVMLVYDPSRPPPDATGPFERGSFSAALAGCPSLNGWGRTEELALAALGERLRERVDGQPVGLGLRARDQALIAAQQMPLDDLVDWLAGRTSEAVVCAEADELARRSRCERQPSASAHWELVGRGWIVDP